MRIFIKTPELEIEQIAVKRDADDNMWADMHSPEMCKKLQTVKNSKTELFLEFEFASRAFQYALELASRYFDNVLAENKTCEIIIKK